MRAMCFASIACAFAVLVFHLGSQRSPDLGPTIRSKNPARITVTNNQPFLEHTFVILNRSPFAVRLDENVRTSCGCTVGSISTRLIPPGEESSVLLFIQIKPGTQYISVQCHPEEEGAFDPLVYELEIDAPFAWRVAPTRSEVRTNGKQHVDVTLTISGPNPPAKGKLHFDLQMPGSDLTKVAVVETGREHVEVKAEIALDPETEKPAVTSGVMTIKNQETGESVAVDLLVLRNE